MGCITNSRFQWISSFSCLCALGKISLKSVHFQYYKIPHVLIKKICRWNDINVLRTREIDSWQHTVSTIYVLLRQLQTINSFCSVCDTYKMKSCVPGSKLLLLAMVIPPLIGNPYNGYINPYYWVDDNPPFFGNNRSLDPSPYKVTSVLV